MNFHPLRVVRVTYIRTHNPYMRADWRKYDCSLVVFTRRFCISLCWWHEFTDNLENEISTLIVHISRVEKILKLGIHLQPAVSIAILLMADAVRFTTVGRVNNDASDREARLLNDQTVGIIDVSP